MKNNVLIFFLWSFIGFIYSAEVSVPEEAQLKRALLETCHKNYRTDLIPVVEDLVTKPVIKELAGKTCKVTQVGEKVKAAFCESYAKAGHVFGVELEFPLFLGCFVPRTVVGHRELVEGGIIYDPLDFYQDTLDQAFTSFNISTAVDSLSQERKSSKKGVLDAHGS